MLLAIHIPSHRFAEWLLESIKRVLNLVGIDHATAPEEVLYLIAVIGLAMASGWIVQRIIVFIVTKVINRRFASLGAELAKYKVLTRSGRVIPPLVLLALIPFAFDGDQHSTHILLIATVTYFMVMTVIAINSALGFVWLHYNTHRNTKNLPLKGIVDILRGTMWAIAAIIFVSMLLDKSPAALLTGLGAFAAVLMLIFKDSILGLVAGVQLSGNDMLRVGDWIQVPDKNANGIVIDVSLIVVKVRNWDNTVAMIPPYSLVSNGFINWRCMKDTGSRHIAAALYIDINTVRPLTDDELQAIQQQVPLLKDFIDVKLKQRSEGATRNVNNSEAGVNGSIDTNLGLLRAYYSLYASQHPYINKERPIMVRILEPTPTGFPLQLFAYLTTADWPAYEAIMADILEHITAIAPTFFLSVYEQPSGRSVYNIGDKEPKGVPYYGNAPVQSATPDPSTNIPTVRL